MGSSKEVQTDYGKWYWKENPMTKITVSIQDCEVLNEVRMALMDCNYTLRSCPQRRVEHFPAP